MFSALVERALRVAIRTHDEETRRGVLVPLERSVHPLHVALMLARWGQDEEVIVAGLMLAVAQRREGWDPIRLAESFNPHVSALVSELRGVAAAPAERLARLSPPAATIAANEELHRLQVLLGRLRGAREPAQVWSAHEGGRERALEDAARRVEALAARVEPRVARALQATLRALRGDVASAASSSGKA